MSLPFPLSCFVMRTNGGEKWKEHSLEIATILPKRKKKGRKESHLWCRSLAPKRAALNFKSQLILVQNIYFLVRKMPVLRVRPFFFLHNKKICTMRIHFSWPSTMLILATSKLSIISIQVEIAAILKINSPQYPAYLSTLMQKMCDSSLWKIYLANMYTVKISLLFLFLIHRQLFYWCCFCLFQ